MQMVVRSHRPFLDTVLAMIDRLYSRSPDIWAWMYVAATPLVWPAIFLGGYSLTRGGGDSCDHAYVGNWAVRDAEFRAAQLVMIVGAGVMIAVGLALLAALITRRHRLSLRRSVPSGIMTALALASYGVIALLSGYTTDCF